MTTVYRAVAERRPQDGGFTLSELMVVVVVLGIIIAIAVPMLGRARSSSDTSAANNDQTLVSRVVRECAALGGALPSSFQLTAAAPQLTITCGANTTTVSTTGSSTVTYTLLSPQTYSVTATGASATPVTNRLGS